MIVAGGAVAFLPAIRAAAAANERWQPNTSPAFLLAILGVYVVNYFIIVFFNVALVGVANSRLMGGSWTFRDGLALAWARKGTIFLWALVAATVGMILRSIEERLGLIGRIVIKLIGVAWALACYFVVPVLAFENLTPFAAVKRSARLFKDTWGERVAGGFSISAVFFVLALPGIGVWIVLSAAFGSTGMLIGLGLLLLYLLLLAVVSSAMQGIFNAALYRDACFKQVPPAFTPQLVSGAWTPKG